ncbi:type II secretion system F family protein [Cellvibrio japonicus]|uniref:MSHA biogenesis protein MshG n=1 Tax=Cellvibrio japonicus (strain Ueda107) TaxID=498211 RepID=B3PKC5_CELJU|nr:type II secretion system F family protein [Cellvibrio japonicus]ACE84544.1 MSHA biogenesis protein MshG [Cellvibrio japonicus Ueda107]QEI12796.1 type II secretion system F family protein [Cellvibrio japonicus]QEI16370.1 type II secretion system F family protein [Cellvibrio japonicus]QEI19948.1 type II secretion system F family protein [Cellvibrio japonicus]
MAIYDFKGRNSDGRLVTGQLDASTQDGAVNQLLGRGITPVSIEPHVEELTLSDRISRSLNAGRVSSVELIMFCRQMHTISRAGIPLVKGLRGLSASIRNYAFQQALNDIVERLEAGVELSSAMRAHPKIFNNMIVSMVSVGENAGRLDVVFKQLSEYLERDHSTLKSIKTALRYPSFVLIAMTVAIAVINIYVIPAFAGLFEKFGAQLPLPTRILITVSDFFVNYWMYILLVLVAAVAWCLHYIKTPEGSRVWGQKKLRLIIVGDIIERASLARYARSFGLMLNAGLPLSNALELSARAIDNPYLGDKIRAIRAGVERGEGLYQTHLVSGMFTPLVLQMIAVGEESGQVDALLAEVASFYESEVEYDVKQLSDRIEPIMIVMLAGFVTIIALGIFLPMWDMYAIQK